MLKKIVFHPKFLKEVKFDPKDKRWVERRSVNARRNISIFYTYLYQSLFGGNICAPFKTDSERMANGDDRIFHPDIIKRGKNKICTEVKSNSTHSSKPFCSISQLENYCYHLLMDLNKPHTNSMIEYAFFRYSYPKREHKVKLDSLNNQNIAMQLAGRKTSLLIVPLNLLLLMFLNSDSSQPYRTHTSEQNYFKIPGKMLVNLAQDKNFIKELMHRTYDDSLEERLLLKQLNCEIYTPKAELYCGKHQMNDFTITRYFNKNPKDWSNHFKKNHQFILTKLLGVKDIYQECKDVPF